MDRSSAGVGWSMALESGSRRESMNANDPARLEPARRRCPGTRPGAARGRGSARSRRRARQPGGPARPTRRGRGCGRRGRVRQGGRAPGRAAPRWRRRATAVPFEASSGDHQPVPAASSTISPPIGKRVEPLGGRVELGVPRGIGDNAVAVAAAAQIPVVVLGGPRGVVGAHLLIGRNSASAESTPLALARQRRSGVGDLRAAGSAGTRCPGRGRRSRSTASPSPRGPGRSVSGAARPHHRQLNEAWNPPPRRSCSGRGHPTSIGSHAFSGSISPTKSGSNSSASSATPSTTRGPGRLK